MGYRFAKPFLRLANNCLPVTPVNCGQNAEFLRPQFRNIRPCLCTETVHPVLYLGDARISPGPVI
jgi:hypothetical protein